MLVAEVRGKSTRQIRRVFALIDEVMAKGIDRLIGDDEAKSSYFFTRYC